MVGYSWYGNDTPHKNMNIFQKKRFLTVVVFLLPSLLLLPVVYYSLTTPFALVDDYYMSFYICYLSSFNRFLLWCKEQFIDFTPGRYRPFFDLYNMVTWKFFGAVAWQHHLSRWLLHFGALFSFSAAYLCFSAKEDTIGNGREKSKSISLSLLPLAFLLYLWLFSPNSPVSRLGPQEINTVFFLGICNWMMARIILHWSGEKLSLNFVFLYLGYLGLSFSKEINIAVMLWIVLFLCMWIFFRFNWRKMFFGVPLIIIFSYTFLQVYVTSKQGGYGVVSITPELIKNNFIWIYRGLFQVYTSNVITSFFSILLSCLVLIVAVKIICRKFSAELLFILFLLGQFASVYLITCTSWAPVLRYWYVLIPLLTILLAFSVKHLMDIVKSNSLFSKMLTVLLGSFVIFFIGCNYYNFLMQTMMQYSVRHSEKELIAELTQLHDSNKYVHILQVPGAPDGELVFNLIGYYKRVSPQFLNKKYLIHTSPPEESGKDYYTVAVRKQSGELKVYKIIENRSDFKILVYAKKLTAIFRRMKDPGFSVDGGAHPIGRNRWFIYENRTF